MKAEVLVLAAALAAAGCGQSQGEKDVSGADRTAPRVRSAFEALQIEVFTPKCATAGGCHGGAAPGGGLDLSSGRSHQSLVNVAASRRPEQLLVVPGSPDRSYLLQRLEPGGDRPTMPFGSQPLTDAELERIREWIRDGAKGQ